MHVLWCYSQQKGLITEQQGSSGCQAEGLGLDEVFHSLVLIAVQVE